MTEDNQTTFEFEAYTPIKGYPELHWTGKRPYRSTQYFPAQLKERYGTETNGWINKIFWGDNLQVMSHLLKEYRGMIDLIYIDPPFDSKANYKKTIAIRGKEIQNDSSSFEEKQYEDIWSNDEYLQYMYERIVLLRELLKESGSIYIHTDWHKVHYFRLILDEVFGSDNFVNEIIWRRKQSTSFAKKQFGIINDTILWYSKTPTQYKFNPEYTLTDEKTQKYIRERFVFDDGDGKGRYMKSPLVNSEYRPNLKYIFHGVNPPSNGWLYQKSVLDELYRKNELVIPDNPNMRIYRKIFLSEYTGQLIQNIWLDIPIVNPMANERATINYPTQKPEALLERIIKSSSNAGDLIFDCFMGSGTTQAVAMKLGRRFIGADINLGALQTTTKRLLNVAKELETEQTKLVADEEDITKYTGFEVYNVNNYDVFRNPVEAKELLMDAYNIQKFDVGSVYDGEMDGRMVKIMPVNRIATKADLSDFIANLPYKTFEARKAKTPGEPVEKITLICMGHEPDLAAAFKQALPAYNIDIEIVDILRDKAGLTFKHDSDARIEIEDGNLIIKEFYPLNLMQKLSWTEDNVEDWKQLVESVLIDWNYDGVVMKPSVLDIPGKNNMVKGIYPIPNDAGVIKIKITDLLSESYEEEVK